MARPTGTPKPYGSVAEIKRAFDAGAGVFVRDDVESLLEAIAMLEDYVNILEGAVADSEVRA